MELITAYLYNISPFDTKNISATTFDHLKRNGWFRDVRSTPKFQIFNKRFKIQEKWYRTIIRFTQQEEEDVYELNVPIPFIIAETESQNVEETAFKDVKVIHGKKVGRTIGYLEEGIPIQLIDEVLSDLKSHTIYREKIQNILNEELQISGEDLRFEF